MRTDEEIRKWMKDVASGNSPRKKLVFDRKTKRLVAVEPNDPRADDNLEFTPQEAQRFGCMCEAVSGPERPDDSRL